MEKPSLENWDPCYADIQDNQNSGNKSSKTQGTGVSVDPRVVPG